MRQGEELIGCREVILAALISFETVGKVVGVASLTSW